MIPPDPCCNCQFFIPLGKDPVTKIWKYDCLAGEKPYHWGKADCPKYSKCPKEEN